MGETLAGHQWARLDELLEDVRQSAVSQQGLPESVALVFGEQGLSAMLVTPTFLTDTADEVTDVLCRVLPSLQAQGIAVIWPALYRDDDADYWAMRVHRWDATVPGQMRTQIWPLPIKDTPDGEPIDIDPPDPWSRRLAGALTRPGPLAHLGVVDTCEFGPDYDFLVVPAGPLDVGPPLHGPS